MEEEEELSVERARGRFGGVSVRTRAREIQNPYIKTRAALGTTAARLIQNNIMDAAERITEVVSLVFSFYLSLSLPPPLFLRIVIPLILLNSMSHRCGNYLRVHDLNLCPFFFIIHLFFSRIAREVFIVSRFITNAEGKGGGKRLAPG